MVGAGLGERFIRRRLRLAEGLALVAAELREGAVVRLRGLGELLLGGKLRGFGGGRPLEGVGLGGAFAFGGGVGRFELAARLLEERGVGRVGARRGAAADLARSTPTAMSKASRRQMMRVSMKA